MTRVSPLPRHTAELLTLLQRDFPLRTQLIDVGLKVWKERNRRRVRFAWRGRQFVFYATIFRYVVTDRSGRGLVSRYH